MAARGLGCYSKRLLISSRYEGLPAPLSLLRQCSQGSKRPSTGNTPNQSSSSSTGKEEYKVPEYYQHNEYSFVDIEVAMSQHRIPQPSSKVQSKQ